MVQKYYVVEDYMLHNYNKNLYIFKTISSNILALERHQALPDERNGKSFPLQKKRQAV